MIVLAFGLELQQIVYLHSIFAQDILVAAEINIFGETLKLSGVESLEVMDLIFQSRNTVLSSQAF